MSYIVNDYMTAFYMTVYNNSFYHKFNQERLYHYTSFNTAKKIFLPDGLSFRMTNATMTTQTIIAKRQKTLLVVFQIIPIITIFGIMFLKNTKIIHSAAGHVLSGLTLVFLMVQTC